MKKCQYCEEKIQDDAIVCRYCGRDLAYGKSGRSTIVITSIFFAIIVAGYQLFTGADIGRAFQFAATTFVAMWIILSVRAWIKLKIKTTLPTLDSILSFFSIGFVSGLLIGPIILGALLSGVLHIFGISYFDVFGIILLFIYSAEGIIISGMLIYAILTDIFHL